MGIMGNTHHIHDHIRIVSGFGNIHGSIEARDRQFLIPQLADRSRHRMLVEGAATAGKMGEFLEVIDLNAGKAHIQSGFYQLFPAKVSPASCRKGEFHTLSSS